MITGIFAIALGAAWAWFYVGVTPPEKSYVLHAKESLPGFQFKSIPVGEQAVEILATTNLLNGVFENTQDKERFMVFAANWVAKGTKQMSVLGHTPEVCWVGSGFRLVALGEPAFMEVDLNGERLVLECRVFQTPDQRSMEMVVWCSVLSGQLLEEGFRFQSDRDQMGHLRINQAANARLRGMNSIIRALVTRQPGDGTKQFVRFSTPVSGDWKDSFKRLERFAEKWLELEINRRPPSTKV